MPDAPAGKSSRFTFLVSGKRAAHSRWTRSQVLLPSSMQPIHGSAMMRPWTICI